MKTAKVDYENQIENLRANLREVKLDSPEFKLFIKKEIRNKQKCHQQKVIPKEIIRRLRIQNKKLMEQVASLKDQIKQTKTNRSQILNRMSDLRKLNRSLSAAVGSCDACWGEDPDCIKCKGNGLAGWRKINGRLFNTYILPTLEKLYGLGGNIKRG